MLGVKDTYNNIVIDTALKQEHKNNDDLVHTPKKKTEQIDETKTAKSYRLMFNYLPYWTYEELSKSFDRILASCFCVDTHSITS